MGKYEVAAEMTQQIFEQNQKLLGPEHPNTLNSQSQLRSVYYHQDKYDEAEELF
jgi:hypothetical protein